MAIKYKFHIILISVLLICALLISKKIEEYNMLVSKQYIVKDNLLFYFEPKPNIKFSSYPPSWDSKDPYFKVVNSDGLNDKTNYPIEKKSDNLRIIVLGDSYTDGAFVSTEKTWPELLEEKLNTSTEELCLNINKYEVINLAVASYDIQYSIERFNRKGIKYSPDIILWFLHTEDIRQVNELLLPLIKKYETLGADDEKNVEKPYPAWEKAYNEIDSKYSTKDIHTIQKNILSSFPKEFLDSLRIITFNNLNEDNLELLNSLKQTSPIITDISKDKATSFSDGHPNEKGHEVIASDVYKSFFSNKKLLCK